MKLFRKKEIIPSPEQQEAKQAVVVSHDFVIEPCKETLYVFLEHFIERNLPLPLDHEKIRETVFQKVTWLVSIQLRKAYFDALQAYLIHARNSATAEEWSGWLRQACLNTYQFNVFNLPFAQALQAAWKGGKFDGISQDQENYLLELYAKAYGDFLSNEKRNGKKEKIPFLLQFATIQHLLPEGSLPTESMEKLLANCPVAPRALVEISDEASHAFPLRGVGSPHGVAVTYYANSPKGGAPVRICTAGTTADEALNRQLFISLFATALACDTDSTFVLLNGSFVEMGAVGQVVGADKGQRTYFSIGPAGAANVRKGVPTVGMTPEESMMLAGDMFRNVSDKTGLVTRMDWQKRDADNLELKVMEAFGTRKEKPVVIRSETVYSEGGTVVHHMPLMRRTEEGSVIPVEIRLPFSLVGSKNTFAILRAAQRDYMEQLINGGERRRDLAKKSFVEADKAVKAWEKLSPKEKMERVAAEPFVIITHEVDFEGGYSKPCHKQVPKMKFEEKNRPQFRKSADEMQKRFAALVKKLKEMNREGGRAEKLTFKLLVDALIRGADVPIDNSEFQKEYGNWKDRSAPLIWAALESAADRLGLGGESLNGDNLLFNSSISEDGQELIIAPWVSVDLHDFAIEVDGKSGTMRVFAGGKAPSLLEALVLDEDSKPTGTNTLEGLHRQFCSWFGRESLAQDFEGLVKAPETLLVGVDSKIRVYLEFKKAKNLLLNGEVNTARRLLDSLLENDLAPIYLWSAYALQVDYEENEFEFNEALNRGIIKVLGNENPDALPLPASLDLAMLERLLEQENRFKGRRDGDLTMNRYREQIRQYQEQLKKLQASAENRLGQARSCDAEYVKKVASDQNIHLYDKEAFEFQDWEKKELEKAERGLMSLEFLEGALNLRELGKGLSFSGSPSYSVCEELRSVLDKVKASSLRESSAMVVVSNLEEALANAKGVW